MLATKLRRPYLTPAEKLTTGKKNPSVLKSSNMPCTGWPLILKDMLGAPKSRQQLTTSSEFSRCWLMEATARGIRPEQQSKVDYSCKVRVNVGQNDKWVEEMEQRGGETSDECFNGSHSKWMRGCNEILKALVVKKLWRCRTRAVSWNSSCQALQQVWLKTKDVFQNHSWSFTALQNMSRKSQFNYCCLFLNFHCNKL